MRMQLQLHVSCLVLVIFCYQIVSLVLFVFESGLVLLELNVKSLDELFIHLPLVVSFRPQSCHLLVIFALKVDYTVEGVSNVIE